jgi:ABC-type lipoprotein export system ATPase subunit/bifunctional DNA-binding transcriptional regulator/antitoxin component of YhaV-PrlF toxin-antitoxin module
MIRCDGLVKIYKVADLEVVALQGLDLTVAAGEMLGIVGTSGSGKSTLLNLLGGLDKPSAGRIAVDGQDLLKLSDRALNRYRRNTVGFVWQQSSRNLLPYLTAQENIELPMSIAGMRRKEKREWAETLLHAVDLLDRRNHRLTQLSGGQQQRVAISVALANKPRLLLADEPTGEVDTATAQIIYKTLQDLSEQLALTVVIVTHDPRIMRQVDRVVAIRDGKTSTETIRKASDLQQVMTKEDQQAGREPSSDPSFQEYVVLDSAGRLQIPAAARTKHGIGDRVELESQVDGILIKPTTAASGYRSEGEVAAMEGNTPGGKSLGDSKLGGNMLGGNMLGGNIGRLFDDEGPRRRRGLLARLLMGRKQ